MPPTVFLLTTETRILWIIEEQTCDWQLARKIAVTGERPNQKPHPDLSASISTNEKICGLPVLIFTGKEYGWDISRTKSTRPKRMIKLPSNTIKNLLDLIFRRKIETSKYEILTTKCNICTRNPS
jgi:hypothetical protein